MTDDDGKVDAMWPPLVPRLDFPLTLRNLTPRRTRALWFVSRLIGGRTIFGYRDETPRKRLVIRLEERR